MTTPQSWAKLSGGYWTQCPPSCGAFSIDTRNISFGDVFVAVHGTQQDGHQFLAEAVSKGASAAIVDHICDCPLPQLVVQNTLAAVETIARAQRQNFHGRVIGVTGSVGKTSTKELLKILLDEKTTFASRGNHNNAVGVPLSLCGLSDIYQNAVLEAGINHVGEMAPLADWIQPDYVLLTAITPVHMEFMHNLETIAAEKLRLAQDAQWTVLPANTRHYLAVQNLHHAVTVGQVSDPEEADWRYDTHNRTLTLYSTKGSKIKLNIPDWTAGMVTNAALACVLCLRLGLDAKTLHERLNTWRPAKHRGEICERDGKRYYVDCYNSSPTALLDRLQWFQQATKGQVRTYVLGGMGELGADSERYHYDVGQQIILGTNDRLIVLGSIAQKLADGAIAAGNASNQITCVGTIQEVKNQLTTTNGPVLLKASKAFKLWEVLE